MNSSVNTSQKGSVKKGAIGGGKVNSGPGVEKAKDFNGTLKKLLKYLGQYKISLIIVILFAILSTVFTIVGPKILGQATTEIYNGIMGKIAGTGSGIDFNAIGRIMLFLIAIYSLSFAFAYIQGFVMTSVSMKLTYRLRNDIARKINRMPLNYFDTTNHGESYK